MGDFAILTKEVAQGLIARGFEPVTVTERVWYFDDSADLRIAIDEILDSLV